MCHHRISVREKSDHGILFTKASEYTNNSTFLAACWHSFLVPGILPGTSGMSRVYSSPGILSRVFLSRVFGKIFGRFGSCPGFYGLSRVFSNPEILSRVYLSRVSQKGRGNYGNILDRSFSLLRIFVLLCSLRSLRGFYSIISRNLT